METKPNFDPTQGRYNVGGQHSSVYEEIKPWSAQSPTPDYLVEMSKETLSRLRQWFKPHNDALFGMMGHKCNWGY